MVIINPNKRKVDVIILAGQSNAEGAGLGNSNAPYVPRQDVLMMKNEFLVGAAKAPEGHDYVVIDADDKAHIEVATERYDGDTCRGSFAFEFARLYADKYLKEDRQLLIVNTAVGGTGFFCKHWGEGEVLFNRMLDMTKSALDMNAENKVVAFLWHQGEHDVNQGDAQGKYDYYKGKTSIILSTVREKFGKDIPFIAGGFCHQWAKDYPDKVDDIYRASKDLCLEFGKAGFAETSDLKSNDQEIGNGDIIHFSRESLRILGQRYFEIYEDIIKK